MNTDEMSRAEKRSFYKKLARVAELVDLNDEKIPYPSIIQTLYVKNALEKCFIDSAVTFTYAQKIAIGEKLSRQLVHITNFTTLLDDIIEGKKILLRNYRLFSAEDHFKVNILKDEKRRVKHD